MWSFGVNIFMARGRELLVQYLLTMQKKYSEFGFEKQNIHLKERYNILENVLLCFLGEDRHS